MLMRALLALVLCAALAAATEDTDSKWSLKGTDEVVRVPQNEAHQYQDYGWALDDELKDTHKVEVVYPAALRKKVVGQHQITYNLVLRSDHKQKVGNPKYRVVEVVDWNECEGAADPCPVNSECKNTIGSYECLCPRSGLDPAVWTPSYSTDGFLIACHHKDECAEDINRNRCDYTISRCINTDFGYECHCNQGYEHPTLDTGSGSHITACVDIDECQRFPKICSSMPNSHCVNTVGSYSCHCDEGYIRTSDNQCKLIETCPSNHKCSKDANCKYINGKESCICADGYEGDGHTCTNVNECEQGLHNCRGKSHCEDLTPKLAGDSINGLTVVSAKFFCHCPKGWKLKQSGDYVECEDVNECDEKGTKCPENSHCVNTEGSYSCVCNDGYVQDGIHCFPEKKPVMTLRGGDSVTHAIELYQYQAYEECGYNLNEEYENADCSVSVDTPTSAQISKPGVYEAKYTVKVNNDEPQTVTRTIIVRDINECRPQPFVSPCLDNQQKKAAQEQEKHKKNPLNTGNKYWKDCDPVAKCQNREDGFECICPPDYPLNSDNQCEDKRKPKFGSISDANPTLCQVCGSSIDRMQYSETPVNPYDEIPLPIPEEERENMALEWRHKDQALPEDSVTKTNMTGATDTEWTTEYTVTDAAGNTALATRRVVYNVKNIDALIGELQDQVQNLHSTTTILQVALCLVTLLVVGYAVVLRA